MTEKRFTLELYDGTNRIKAIKDNGEIIYPPKVVGLLNELNEENEDNKRLIKYAYSDNDRLRNKNERLHKDWDKLWELCKEHFTDEEIIKELER